MKHECVHKSPPPVPIQSTPLHPISLRSIFILLAHLGLGLFASGFPTKILMSTHPSCPHTCYMPCQSHPHWLDHFNYMWRRVQIVRLLIMQVSLTSYHFIPLRSEYFPRHPVLKQTRSMLLRKQISHSHKTVKIKIYTKLPLCLIIRPKEISCSKGTVVRIHNLGST
jgi:hypothetical protein